MNIHVFMGVIGSGKDYAASQIKGSVKVSFADALRDDIWKLIGWKPSSNDKYEEFKESAFLENVGLGIKFTGRDLLQRYGTELRRRDDREIWVKKTIEEIEDLSRSGVKDVCITDARFFNEIAALRKLGMRSHLNFNVDFTFCNYISDRYNPKSDHSSEITAQQFLKLRYKHMDNLNDYIYNQLI